MSIKRTLQQKLQKTKSTASGSKPIKKLLISHFFNEEYLLPYWLKHHRVMFDHGILIDNHSTDRSVEICRELVPNWTIVPSQNATFSGIMCDFEVMKHEEQFPSAWKLVLNTTEFLVGSQIDNVINFLTEREFTGGYIPGAVMVDHNADEVLDPNLPLVAQKHHGAWEADFPYDLLGQPWYDRMVRTRILHNYAIGAYKPGRHETHLPHLLNIKREHLGVWWYGYSPWTAQGISRKLQIKATIDPFDAKVGFGHQHNVALQELNLRHAEMVKYSYALDVPEFYPK